MRSKEKSMPVKTKPQAKPKAKAKAAPKPVKKAASKAKKAPGHECLVCGYRVIIDEACGCVEEHVLLCCGEPMKRA
jgi:hypothetical protein